jgi:hypothetical protein
MALTPEQQKLVIAQMEALTPQQLVHVQAILAKFSQPIDAKLVNGGGSFVTQCVVTEMGVRLMAHHARSTQAMTKTLFEHAFNDSLNACKIPSEMHKSGTNRGYDLTVNGVRVSLKSESSSVRVDKLHISKWMELGKDPWEPMFQHRQFLGHLDNYDVILTLRCLSKSGTVSYELLEIPKAIFTSHPTPEFVLKPGKTSGQKAVPPASAYVRDAKGGLIYELYHDGGSERKLQIKQLAKSACIVRATWQF